MAMRSDSKDSSSRFFSVELVLDCEAVALLPSFRDGETPPPVNFRRHSEGARSKSGVRCGPPTITVMR